MARVLRAFFIGPAVIEVWAICRIGESTRVFKVLRVSRATILLGLFRGIVV